MSSKKIQHVVHNGLEHEIRDGPQNRWAPEDVVLTTAGSIKWKMGHVSRYLGELDLSQEQERKIRRALYHLFMAFRYMRSAGKREGNR